MQIFKLSKGNTKLFTWTYHWISLRIFILKGHNFLCMSTNTQWYIWEHLLWRTHPPFLGRLWNKLVNHHLVRTSGSHKLIVLGLYLNYILILIPDYNGLTCMCLWLLYPGDTSQAVHDPMSLFWLSMFLWGVHAERGTCHSLKLLGHKSHHKQSLPFGGRHSGMHDQAVAHYLLSRWEWFW